MQFFNYTFLPIGNFTKSFCGFTSRKAVFAREETLKLRSPTSSLALLLFRTRLSYEHYWPHKTVRLRSNFCKAKVMTIKSSQECCSVLTQFWKYRLFKLIQNLKTILSRKSFAKMIFIKFRSNLFKGSWV